MDIPKITDWMSAVGTLLAAVAAVVAALSAIYAIRYTRRAAEESAKAAVAAVDQVRELQAHRTPKAVLKVRATGMLDVDQHNKYGRGKNQFRSGPGVFLDVWNASGPTIMVMKVTVAVDGAPPEEKAGLAPSLPQLVVESGKVESFNVGHRLLSIVAARESQEFLDVPDNAAAQAQFTVDYFSIVGEQSVQIRHKFRFLVSDEYLNVLILD